MKGDITKLFEVMADPAYDPLKLNLSEAEMLAIWGQQDFKLSLEWLTNMGDAVKNNASLPHHVRNFAGLFGFLSGRLHDCLVIGKISHEESARLGMTIGFWLARFKLSENEKPATAGRRVQEAAQRKGRKPPKNSVRAKLLGIPDWKKMSTRRLVLCLAKLFPDKEQDNLRRQIIRLKKSGQ